MAKGYNICSRCIMDTTDSDIKFNDDGVCNHCLTFEELAKEIIPFDEGGEEIVNALAQKIKKAGKGKSYDCIIGVSGGVDSTFVAFRVKQLGLRPLAVHLDNGWDSELAVNNIEKTLKTLDIDLYTHVIDWEEFKSIQLAFLRSSTTEGELPTDHAILAILYRIAAEQNLQYIIVGGNHNSEGILPVDWAYGSKDYKYLKNVLQRFGNPRVESYPTLSFMRYLYYIYFKRIKSIRILEYMSYDREEAMKILEKQLGWRYYGGKHYESIYTRFYQGYVLPKKFNIDKRKCHYSSLICSGQMTREEAIAKLADETYPVKQQEEDREYVIKKLCITNKEFIDIMSAPNKTFRDYPNSYEIQKMLFSIVKTLKRIGITLRTH